MKKLVLFFAISFASMNLQAQVQPLPYMATPTMMPQSPTPNDSVKIVIRVTTPNQGVVVDVPTFTVSHNPKEIIIRGCYWQGMLTATQTYVDTLVIGKLQSGTYTIKQQAFLSTTQQHCTAVDSNRVVTAITVSGVTALKEENFEEVSRVFPNPVKDILMIADNRNYTGGAIYSMDGRLIKIIEISKGRTVAINDLQSGVYFIRLSAEDKMITYKFIKE